MGTRYRSKPVDTKYVEALHDEASNTYFVQPVTREGKAAGPIEQMSAENFAAQYDPMVRKPKASNGNGKHAAK